MPWRAVALFLTRVQRKSKVVAVTTMLRPLVRPVPSAAVKVFPRWPADAKVQKWRLRYCEEGGNDDLARRRSAEERLESDEARIVLRVRH